MRAWVTVVAAGLACSTLLAGCGGDTDRDAAEQDATRGGTSARGGASSGGAGGEDTRGDGGELTTGGASQAAAGGAVQSVGGQPGQAGAGGSAGVPLPGLCDAVFPRPPGCPCTASSECDGWCLAPPRSVEPCDEATLGQCANPTYGGCVCQLDEQSAGIVCIELEECPASRPEDLESCTTPAMVCSYDTPLHERCWCMNRFGEPVWECAREDADCPYAQPTPESACVGDIDCFYATLSSLAYRCTCVDSRWSCEQVGG